jgi:hypothetical protein
MMGKIVDISEVLLQLGLSSSVTEEERAIASVAISRAESAVIRHLKYNPAQAERTEFYPQQNMSISGRGVWEANEANAYFRHYSSATTNALQVQHLPIRSSPAIDLRIDYDGRHGTQTGAFSTETKKVEGQDFWPNYDGHDSDGNSLCKSGLIRSIGLWPTESGAVRITYTGGYSEAELHGQDSVIDAAPILDSVIDEAVRRFKKAYMDRKQAMAGFTAGPFTSESLGDYSYSVNSALASKLFGSVVDLTTSSKEKLADFVNLGWCLMG